MPSLERLLAWVITSVALLINQGLWIDLVAPVVGLTVTYAAAYTWRSRRTEQVRDWFESNWQPKTATADGGPS